MATSVTSIDSQHKDMIHDAQLDYYAKKLATCSSDRTIRIYDMSSEQPVFTAELTGHEGPVWQVSWAHPKFGVILASCCYDGKVILYREAPANNWQQLFVHSEAASVNSIAWAPHEHGLCLACASSSGNVSILEYTSQGWGVTSRFTASDLGCNAVSWAPVQVAEEGAPLTRRLVTGSCDKSVKVSEFDAAEGKWVDAPSPAIAHTDWVRDVAWAPSPLPGNMIASCGEDGKCYVYTQDAESKEWTAKSLGEGAANSPVWRVSWSVSGNVLAVASGDHKVALWKESLEQGGTVWRPISNVAEDGSLVQA